MLAGMKIRTPEFCDSDAPAFLRKLQLNDTVHISRGFEVLGTHEERRSAVGRKSKERLSEPSLMKHVRGEITEVAEAIDENPLRFHVLDRFRDLTAYRLTLHLSRRKDVVYLDLGKHFRRR